MTRNVSLAVFAASVLLAASAPAAPAAKIPKLLGQFSGAIKALQKAVRNIEDTNSGQTASIHDVDVRVDTVVANVAALTAGVPAIVDGLNQVKDGLAMLSAAVEAARPQFGTFTSGGARVSGTGQVLAASAGKYVIDFGSDVSKRFLVATPLPNSGSAGFPTVAGCAAVTGAITCQSVQGLGSPDVNPNHVLVVFGTSGATAPAQGFSVAALSG